LPQSGGGKVQISSGRLLRLLLEGMQHKNGILYLGDVKHSKRSGLVADADFAHPLSYTRHRFPITRLKTLLNLVQLNAGFLPGCLRKIPQLIANPSTASTARWITTRRCDGKGRPMENDVKITVIMKAAVGQVLTGWDAFLKAFCPK